MSHGGSPKHSHDSRVAFYLFILSILIPDAGMSIAVDELLLFTSNHSCFLLAFELLYLDVMRIFRFPGMRFGFSLEKAGWS